MGFFLPLILATGLGASKDPMGADFNICYTDIRETKTIFSTCFTFIKHKFSLFGCYMKHILCFGSYLIHKHAICFCYKYNNLFHTDTNLNIKKKSLLGTGCIASVNAAAGGGATAGSGVAASASAA